MRLLFEHLFGEKLNKETAKYLQTLTEAHTAASRQQADRLLDGLNRTPDTKITLGETTWGKPVAVPLSDIVRAHGLVSGTTGSGKTRLALRIIEALLDSIVESLIAGDPTPAGLGVLDPKSDLYLGTLFLIAKKLEGLQRNHPQVARKLRQLIVLIDFSSGDPVSSYNILARWPEVEADFFAANRADVLMDLLEGSDKLNLCARGVLKKLLLLMSEQGEPITKMGDLVENERFRARLLAECRDRELAGYFTYQFPQVPKPTLAALLRRMDALFASSGVRLALAGTSAPNFRRLQDEGKIVLVNSFGTSIARSVRRVLQKLVFSDKTQAVFARQNTGLPSLELCDEGQNFFQTESLRDNVSDLLTMSRSKGYFLAFLTQNATTAVNDPRLLRVLHTNIRWAFAMRGEPGDAAFLKSALPITERKLRPRSHPFAEQSFYSPSEERGIALDEIFTFFQSILLEPSDVDRTIKMFTALEYPGNDAIPKPEEEYYTYAGEVPWCNTWRPRIYPATIGTKTDEVNVTIPVREYSWESYHSTENEAGGTYFPSKEVCEHLNLYVQIPNTTMAPRNADEAATISVRTKSGSHNSEHLLLMRQDLLDRYLREKNLALVLFVWGERRANYARDDARELEGVFNIDDAIHKQGFVYQSSQFKRFL